MKAQPYIVLLLVALLAPVCAISQTAETQAAAIVPHLVNFSGMASDAHGKIASGIAGIAFSIYKEQSGGVALWTETQIVRSDANGNYSVLLGSTKPEGFAANLFPPGETRWLGVRTNNEKEQARVLLLSLPAVPKPADGEKAGGGPVSAFVETPAAAANSKVAVPAAEAANEISCTTGTACKKFFIPKFASNGGAALVNDSAISQSGSVISLSGPEFVSGNISTPGGVSSSSMTTTASVGGVNATMTGSANGIGAVEGSATATGAAGFTFGVIGQSASDSGRGVFGLGTGATGVGVIGETTKGGIGVVGKALPGSNGWAFSASGHAQQDRTSGGWVKALVYVQAGSPPYTITRCFNSTLPGAAATTPPCGFNLIEAQYAEYNIDFGFEVDDRFWSVSPVGYFIGGDNGTIIANAWTGSILGKTVLQVDLTTDSGNYQTTDFTVAIF